jgi:hypothetical protein
MPIEAQARYCVTGTRAHGTPKAPEKVIGADLAPARKGKAPNGPECGKGHGKRSKAPKWTEYPVDGGQTVQAGRKRRLMTARAWCGGSNERRTGCIETDRTGLAAPYA